MPRYFLQRRRVAIRDVIHWILSFGSKIKVLAPKSLAEHVRKEHYIRT
ncbi:MAG: WYL domain-containing protein [Verrucomicrobia bacterium]|nr:WYL domain-containing protein [Verrucomicrobiota bacterium]MBU4247587.1 WYL domain-containing protein [Verrucomicrobiota bacterium]MBU4291201.1 WYL domain-containing protein [Verrucomicrobiota bacterium]MBU4428457.1 WYL domain-containing protein [Verrucomicrobiota bacterium]MBU4496845.1 WYL domain-containing protein [Verrucomicrobiota bacterium]